MATSPKIPTARKVPVTSSPSSKDSPKPKQQRKNSTAQGPPKSQQKRKNSGAKPSPKVIISKKNSSVVGPQQQRKNSDVQASLMAGNKRNIKTEAMSSTSAESGGNAPASQMVPLQKKQKFEPETKSETSSETVAGLQTATPSQSPKQTLIDLFNTTTPAVIQHQLFTHMLQHYPILFPSPGSPISSAHIDTIAHAMWQVSFNHGRLLQRACQYSALFAPLKLAALARLNFLPSWWFCREMLVKELISREEQDEKGWKVDDAEMETQWKKTCKWAVMANKSRIMMGGWGKEGLDIMAQEERERVEMEMKEAEGKLSEEEGGEESMEE